MSAHLTEAAKKAMAKTKKVKTRKTKVKKVKAKKTRAKSKPAKKTRRETKSKVSAADKKSRAASKHKMVEAATAESMAARQRAISISEFFAKNRHLLGFDNPRKALLTAVKEAVDNSLDACEEAHILPDLTINIQRQIVVWQ
jgi:DNA topoisomerase-6 subunit B